MEYDWSLCGWEAKERKRKGLGFLWLLQGHSPSDLVSPAVSGWEPSQKVWWEHVGTSAEREEGRGGRL
jgi:hypothetical protein